MRIRLTRAFPQPTLGKVIPAGSVIDAPPGLSERLCRTGGGELVSPPPPAPPEAQAEPKPTRKKATRRG